MKFSAIVLSALLLVGASANDNLRMSHESRQLAAEDKLGSEECASFVEDKVQKTKAAVDKYSEYTIKAFFCNPIERKETQKKIKKVEKDVEEASRRNLAEGSCELAFETKLLEAKSAMKKAAGSIEDCRDEIEQEIFALKDMNNRRKLPLCGGICVGAAGGLIANVAAPAILSFFSDRRLKKNINLVGSSNSGIPIYTFQYLPGTEGVDSNAVYSGVMAQDLLESHEHSGAVIVGPDGFYKVNYEKIDVDMHKLN